ncbi:hypothetical protein V1282_003920 [Nitrobacteraceae bacterium AZCC 2146]
MWRTILTFGVTAEFAPRLHLPFLIVGDGERCQLVEVHAAVAVHLNEVGVDGGQLEALFHHGGGDAEARADVIGARAVRGMRIRLSPAWWSKSYSVTNYRAATG